MQFAIQDKTRVVTFDPETAKVTVLGELLDDWAAWILEDVNAHGCRAHAKQWQNQHGALQPEQRLIPRKFFVLGGDYSPDNIIAKDAIECMRIHGPIAQRIHQLPDGTALHMTTDGQSANE